MSKYILALMCALTFQFNGFSQDDSDKKRYEKELEEKKVEHIQKIVNNLNVDDFQREIISQKLDSYYNEVTKIFLLDLPDFQKKQLILDLDARHFYDIKDMVSEDVMEKIMEGLKGKIDDKDKKKKKRNRKTKN